MDKEIELKDNTIDSSTDKIGFSHDDFAKQMKKPNPAETLVKAEGLSLEDHINLLETTTD